MHYFSSSTPALVQPTNTVYKFRPNAWTFVLIYQCLVMTLPILKLLHVTAVGDWAWSLVTLPIWAPSALLAVVLVTEQVIGLGKGKVNDQMPSLMAEPSAVSY